MVTRRVESFLHQLAEWAAVRPGVRSAVLVGSQARSDTPADSFSDVDVALFADEPDAFLTDTGWLHMFGEPLLTFVESTAVGGARERRVLYADGLEVDFSVFPATAAPALAADPEAVTTILRGYRIHHDELGLASLFGSLSRLPPVSRELGEIAQDFWYHALWTAKKWRRGEALVARSCLESYLKPLLLEAERLRAGGDTWHGARFAESWAAPEVVEACWRATARSPEELPVALVELCTAFAEISPHEAARSRLEEFLA
jgi:aminoglycoside 6-adenylyltransferase